MNLSFALLKERLAERFSRVQGHNARPKALYGRPVLYEAGAELLPGRIYIIEEIPRGRAMLPRDVLFLLPRLPALEVEGSDSLTYLAVGDASLVELLNLVQDIFDEYDGWEQRLSKLLLSGGSLQQLLNQAFSLLGCPLCLISRGFSMIASAGQEMLPAEYQIFNNSEKRIEYINSMKQDDFYNDSQNFEEPYIFPAKLTGIRSWNVNIRQFGYTTHRLMMLEYPRPLTKGDACLLEMLASYVRYLLYHSSEMQLSGENNLHAIFLRVLSDSKADYVEISQQLSAFGWYPKHDYMAMVLQGTYMDQQNLTTNAVCSYIEELLPATCSLPYKKDMVVFFNLTLLHMDKESASEKLTCFIRDSFFKAGYSRSMHGHMNLRRQYVQACLALEVGCRYYPHIWIHHFNQIALFYLLEQTMSQLPDYMVCHEPLLRLKEYDAAQGTNYMQTLRTYLENHLNAVKSAKDLFIHRSTFLYRLEKIKKILETDLDDPDEILYLLLSCRLLELKERRAESENI